MVRLHATFNAVTDCAATETRLARCQCILNRISNCQIIFAASNHGIPFLKCKGTSLFSPQGHHPEPASRQLPSDRRRKKRRRRKQSWREHPVRENLVHTVHGGRGRQQQQQRQRQPGGKYREERRRRRRNRKRGGGSTGGGGGSGSRPRLEGARRKWRDDPVTRLIKILNEQQQQRAGAAAGLLGDNPLNLSSTRPSEDSG